MMPGHAHGRETVQMRRLRLLVASEVTDPVVKIIHGNEEDIGAGRRLRAAAAAVSDEKNENGESEFHECNCVFGCCLT